MRFKLIYTFLLLSIFTLGVNVFAQDPAIDSLKLAFKNAEHDTTRCIILNELIETENEDKVWSIYNDQLFKLAEKKLVTTQSTKILKNFYLKYIAIALNNFGYLAEQHGDITKALEYHNKSIQLQVEIKNKEGIAMSLNNMGFIYNNQGDIPKALENHHKSLQLREDIKDKFGIAMSLNNIGSIYDNQGDLAKSLDYYKRSLKIQEEIKDKFGMSISLNNIGAIYGKKGNFKKALTNYQWSLKLQEEINDKTGIATSLNNIGIIYKNHDDIKKAEENFKRSLLIREEIKDEVGISYSLNSIAILMLQKGEIKKAEEYALRSLKIAQELGFPENIKNTANTLKSIYKDQNKYDDALKMYELEIQMHDSINNEATKKTSIQKHFQYEYEKKSASDSVVFAKGNEIKEAEIAKQKAEIKVKQNQQLALYGGLLLVLVFAGFMYSRFKVTQKQKTLIEQQKTTVEKAHVLLEEKNEEIIASIRYAKRIQDALMTSQKYIERNIDRLKSTNKI